MFSKLFIVLCTVCYGYFSNEDKGLNLRAAKLNLDHSFFPKLKGIEMGAMGTSVSLYPWIARVLHSVNWNYNHICTAVCLQQNIFITAYRCIYSSKVQYTSLLYLNKPSLFVKAFVFPSKLSHMGYDDIAFIVTTSWDFKGPWSSIKLDTTKRTDEAFQWFKKLKTTGYNVIGYASSYSKNEHKNYTVHRAYTLSRVEGYVGLDICPYIATNFGKLKAYNVPCFHTCTVAQFKKARNECTTYHGAEGSAVFVKKPLKLFGIVTWGVTPEDGIVMPVGFSSPNSKNFFKDYECAKAINKDKKNKTKAGYYQSLCKK